MEDRKIVVSGIRATGGLHLGNYFGAVKNWVDLQAQYDCYFFVADWHALTTDYGDPSALVGNSLEVVADCIAAGLDPERSVIFLQSFVPAHAELYLLFSMFTPLGWLERVPTYKEQIRQIGNKDLATFGFLGYPVLQAADILIYRGDMVPVGEDQASHLELSREIARRFNSYYGKTLPEPQALFTPAAKVPGLDGRKMSKSYGNTINIADSPDEIRRKCTSMFTDPQRVRRDDPGHPETCNLYEFHRLLSPPELQERVARECRLAQIGCVEDKALIADQIIAFLEPMRQRREEVMRDPGALLEMLRQGSARANERAELTMQKVRAAMKLDYERFVESKAT
ncbi:MAG: tryptophan--tRNA ligase [Acidobacteria bacterium]|nr:tryptophan--tRNA ligase [Acidobacteriota bacterium]MCZ6726066.1 tryptophan--tRNA ligase [Acidobacteriota bacterium]